MMAMTRARIRAAAAVFAVLSPFAGSTPAAFAGPVLVAAPPPVLREHVVVHDGRVRLGDIFSPAGGAHEVVIAEAPAAGKQLVLPAATLARLASGYGLAWRPASGAERTVIERDSIVLGEAEIVALVEEALVAKGLQAGMTVELTTAVAGARVPAGARLALENLSYAPSGRRFSAVLVVLDDGRAVQRLALAGQVYRLIQIPVSARELRHGDVIGHADLDWLAVRDSAVPASAVLDADALVGLTPRRMLRTGAPIAIADVGRPVLVPRGGLVTLVLVTPAMSLTARGRALEAGGLGDTVRIANVDSQAVIAGVVTAAGEVTVTGSADRATDRRSGRR
jgi:flagella basal body P-ring formation protein FlgA